jgi:phosphotransferase system IIA component
MCRSGYPINEWQKALSQIFSKLQNHLIKLATIPKINFQQSLLGDGFQLLFRAE